jgi:hypothetical protein
MSPEVVSRVKDGRIKYPECILCGACADFFLKYAVGYMVGRN